MGKVAENILAVLDRACDVFTFPMLDNGYFYLAATRLSLHRSQEDWALVFETFGFSPRQGTPSTYIKTFASRLHDRDPPERYATREAYESYLAKHPQDDFRSVDPLGQIEWMDDEHCVAAGLREVTLRGRAVLLPALDEYGRVDIELDVPGRVRIFEACRYLAAIARDDVLATSIERRISVRPEMKQLMQLEEWNHPSVVEEDCRPSGSRTFQQLARVLETGDVRMYTRSLATDCFRATREQLVVTDHPIEGVLHEQENVGDALFRVGPRDRKEPPLLLCRNGPAGS